MYQVCRFFTQDPRPCIGTLLFHKTIISASACPRSSLPSLSTVNSICDFSPTPFVRPPLSRAVPHLREGRRVRSARSDADSPRAGDLSLALVEHERAAAAGTPCVSGPCQCHAAGGNGTVSPGVHVTVCGKNQGVTLRCCCRHQVLPLYRCEGLWG